MSRQIDSLVTDIYSLFGPEAEDQGLFDVDVFEKFGTELSELMTTRFNTKRDSTPRLRMSNIGRKDRQLWYDLNSSTPGEQLTPSTYVKFMYGDMTEQLVLLLARLAGHEVTDEQRQVELNGIKGSIDCIIDGVLVDVKSASTFSFQKFASGALFDEGNDPFGYVGQICGYKKALGVDRAGFLVLDKTLGKICFCEIPSEIVEAYDVEGRIEHIKEVVANPVKPDRCYKDVPDGKSGNMKLDTGCSYCQYKFDCWADVNDGQGLKTYFYSTGPRYLSRVVKEPKVSEFPS